MLLPNPEDLQTFKYTKIKVVLELSACPSDHENRCYFLDVNCNYLCQENCYIGSQKVERIEIQRISASKTTVRTIAPRWDVEILIAEAKAENEVLILLDELCRSLSLACGKFHDSFQYSGLSGFTYRNMDVRRSYASEDVIFGDSDFNQYCSPVKIRSLETLPAQVFALPQTERTESPLVRQLNDAFLTAMKSRDAISRYILLYYLFEIMYLTPQYQRIKAASEEASPPKVRKEANQKRSELLCQYLQQEFGIQEYESFGQHFCLSPNILCEIIKTRNDLAHRADNSKVSKMMYHHLLPILQCVLNSKSGNAP